MMRFQYAINAALGALLVTPALTLGVQHNDSLEAALARTVASLEELGRIEQRLRQQDPSAIADTLRVTEPPLATSADDAGARDAALADLRGVVGRLQHEADEIENKASPQTLAQLTRVPLIERAPDNAPVSAADLTVGLDDALRRRLGERVRPVLAEPARITATKDERSSKPSERTAFEGESYAADTLRLGRALYRQGEYQKALEHFENAVDAESQYWKARCFEKLARDVEAIAAYTKVIESPDGGYSAQRAKEDLEFLQWRLSFERARAKSAGASTEARKP